MKATTQHTLFCECGHALEYVGDVVRCNQKRCAHFGKRFAAPAFELAELRATEVAGEIDEAIEDAVDDQAT